jgi:anaerobic selenocysteine-containing dehydrogenase
MTGVDVLREADERYTVGRAADDTGLAHADVLDLLGSLRRARRVAVHVGTGLTMAPSTNVTTWLANGINIVMGSQDQPGGTFLGRA